MSGPEGSHTYNAADEVTGTGYGFDGAGNQTSAPSQTFAYNVLGQTSSVTTSGSGLAMGYADLDSKERTSAGATTFATSLLGVTGQTTSGVTTTLTRDPDGNLLGMRKSRVGYYYVPEALGSTLTLHPLLPTHPRPLDPTRPHPRHHQRTPTPQPVQLYGRRPSEPRRPNGTLFSLELIDEAFGASLAFEASGEGAAAIGELALAGAEALGVTVATDFLPVAAGGFLLYQTLQCL